MASVTHGFMKFFRGSAPDTASKAPAQRLTRRSSGMAEVARSFKSEEPLCVLDVGATSAANIRYLTERGHKIYSEDLLGASTDPGLIVADDLGQRSLDTRRFFNENLVYPSGQFDIVLCWNLADYLDENLVKPVVERLWTTMKPGGKVLAFFHTREAGPDAPCYRYHIVNEDTLEMQHILDRRDMPKGATGSFRLQRVFNNRHIENLFRDFGSIKFFLTRDNIREVLVVR